MRRKNKGVNITFSLYLARRRPMLAPPRRQSLIPPSGHANRAPRIPPAAGPCWRRPADIPFSDRRGTPTGRALPPKGPSSRRACPSSPEGPPLPGGPSPLPRRPLPAGGSAAPFKSKFSRDNRHKKRKISPLQQFQPKIKIVSIKKSRAFWGKY